MQKTTKFWVFGAVSEVTFFLTLYYILSLVNVMGNLWTSSAILWVLINVSIVFCPVLNPELLK